MKKKGMLHATIGFFATLTMALVLCFVAYPDLSYFLYKDVVGGFARIVVLVISVMGAWGCYDLMD